MFGDKININNSHSSLIKFCKEEEVAEPELENNYYTAAIDFDEEEAFIQKRSIDHEILESIKLKEPPTFETTFNGFQFMGMFPTANSLLYVRRRPTMNSEYYLDAINKNGDIVYTSTDYFEKYGNIPNLPFNSFSRDGRIVAMPHNDNEEDNVRILNAQLKVVKTLTSYMTDGVTIDYIRAVRFDNYNNLHIISNQTYTIVDDKYNTVANFDISDFGTPFPKFGDFAIGKNYIFLSSQRRTGSQGNNDIGVIKLDKEDYSYQFLGFTREDVNSEMEYCVADDNDNFYFLSRNWNTDPNTTSLFRFASNGDITEVELDELDEDAHHGEYTPVEDKIIITTMSNNKSVDFNSLRVIDIATLSLESIQTHCHGAIFIPGNFQVVREQD